MNKNGAIIIVEDDQDDQDLLTFIFSGMGIQNEIIMFQDGLEAYEYLVKGTTMPFIIISDINMPKMSGIQLKQKIKDVTHLNLYTVPFIFMSTSSPHEPEMHEAKKLVQGYFKKPSNLVDYTHAVKGIIDFWSNSPSPYF